MAPTRLLLLAIVFSLSLVSEGCSARKFAVRKVADAIAASGATFSSDGDPPLVRDAVPFSLKLIESLLADAPEHQGLLLAASRGFTQYAYAFIQEDADEMVTRDIDAAGELRTRAKRLYLRARDYGLRGLEVKYRAFGKAVRENPQAAVVKITKPSDALAICSPSRW
jgi:hypothetical protein